MTNSPTNQAPYEPPALSVLGFVHELTLTPPGKTRSGPDAFALRGGGGGGGLTGASS